MEALAAARMSAVTHRVVVMGVSGSGKSTVGAELAILLGVPFQDGDALHPAADIAKMHAGHPLTDDDRWPWLRSCGAWLAGQDGGGVIACSALKRSYRDLLRGIAPGTTFLDLDGPRAVLEERVGHRPGHFMPAELLDSQLADYEPLGADEAGRVLSITQPSERIAREYADWLVARPRRG